MRKLISFLVLCIAVIVLLLLGTWGALALFYTSTLPEILRYSLALVFALLTLLTIISLIRQKFRLYTTIGYALSWALLLLYYSSIEPSNDRDWQRDVAVLSYAEKHENNITIHNIRNFHYKTEIDYTPDYYNKSFDINTLNGVDVIAVYWMGPAIAHVFVSFSFEDGEHLAVSIETRKEKGEAYSTIKGFFKEYELIYVVADERDVIGLRTNYRFNPVEDVYIYPLEGTKEEAQNLFSAYIDKINALKVKAAFYNTLTTNCTTTIWENAKSNIKRLPMSWKILASGYVPEYLYENNRLKSQGLSFEALREMVHVNQRALDAGISPTFSDDIRSVSHTHSLK